MNRTARNPKVDALLEKTTHWQKEFQTLRSILLTCGLTEELKWGSPCYVHQGKNVVLIHGFKEYCALLFFKGALLKDPKKILVHQTANVQAARQIRFTTAAEIDELKSAIKAYVMEAAKVEQAGKKVNFKKTADFTIPTEFQVKLRSVPGLKKAFTSLTPGRQRAYLLYFSAAKQATTRESRIEKYLDQILDGKGLDD